MIRLFLLAFLLRSLVVPGLAPAADPGSPLGLSLAFCHTLQAQDHHETSAAAGHGADNHDHGGPARDHDGGSSHSLCDVTLVGGVFAVHVPLDFDRAAQPPGQLLRVEYRSPAPAVSYYSRRQPRAPPA